MGEIMVFHKVNKQSGFSLVELMIVVGIIGILSALAIPQFSAFQARARQAEAKTSLAHIYTLQQAYFNDNNAYHDLGTGITGRTGNAASANNGGALGFNISNVGSARYTYSWQTSNAGANFIAQASSDFAAPAAASFNMTPAAVVQTAGNNNLIVPGCVGAGSSADVHRIDDTRNLIVYANAVTACK
jgi:prepilin-type N-terminal cleavage/methylation domain-containing protein